MRQIPAEGVLALALGLVREGIRNPLVALEQAADITGSDGVDHAGAYRHLRRQAGMPLVDWYGPAFSGSSRKLSDVVSLFEEALFSAQLGDA